jgi:hypothetical protein
MAPPELGSVTELLSREEGIVNPQRLHRADYLSWASWASH